jgi:hypothetical protein
MDDARIRQVHRRAFLARTSALGAASPMGFSRVAYAEPPPEVTRIRLVRVPALRLRDAGMIKSTPQQIIERGSNFTFPNELKKELKA